MHSPVKLAVVGAGSRGCSYASYAQTHPDQLPTTTNR